MKRVVGLLICLTLAGGMTGCGWLSGNKANGVIPHSSAPFTVIEDMLKKTTCTYYPSGKIKTGTLNKHNNRDNTDYFSYEGYDWKADSIITFYESGKVKSGFLYNELEINGITYSANLIELYENGALSYGTIKNSQTIQGVKYGFLSTINYYPSGKVSGGGSLDTDQIIRGKKYRGDSYIHFYPNGEVEEGMLCDYKIYKHMKVKENTYSQMDNTGRVISAEAIDRFRGELVYTYLTNDDFKLNGVVYPKGTEIFQFISNYSVITTKPVRYGSIVVDGLLLFSKEGRLLLGYLTEKTRINGYEFINDIELYENGNVRVGQLAHEAEYQGVTLSTYIDFFPDGKVRKGYLAKDYISSDKNYRIDTEVYFTEDGEPYFGDSVYAQETDVDETRDEDMEKDEEEY